MRILLALLILCSSAQAFDGRREIVLVIIDDVSTHSIGVYDEGVDSITGEPYATPEIDTLVDAGQVYLNFMSQPLCSPSRRDLFYAMNPLLHGAGRALNETFRVGVPWAQRLSLVASMQAVDWQVGIAGKHHIQDWGEGALLGTAATQAAAMGFDFVDAMMLANPIEEYPPTSGSPHADGNNHYSWIETVAATGATSVTTTYTTDAINAAAVARLQNSSNMDPMLLIVSYSAPHAPYNPPPGSDCGASPTLSYVACYGPALEYIDDNLPSITAELDFSEDTIIIISENGRPNNTQSNDVCTVGAMKGFANPCGTRVPMIIRGVDVTTTGDVSTPIQIADLHDTLLELAGAPQYGQESESFVDCLANPSTCAPRAISSAITFLPVGLPVAAYEGESFSRYDTWHEMIAGTTLYGMGRAYDDDGDPLVDFTDTLYDLGSPSTIDTAKRYGQVEIVTPSVGEQQDALAAMVAEITRLVAARWTGPPNRIVGATMVGVGTK